MVGGHLRSTQKIDSVTRIAGRYELLSEIARGGMGTVWLGRDAKLGRKVAVKVMAQELAQSSESLQRFEREARAVAQLRSAHVVEVYDYGVQDGLPFIVMELLDGENLSQRLRRVGKLALPAAAGILEQMCRGLKEAHGAGLIHRDLKPSNIFLATRDDQEVVKLLDFGVVKALDPMTIMGSSEATSTGTLLGTPQYMSPEQARATRTIDHRSDLWSAAVIAFRMLTGNNPFVGESVGDVVLKICSDELPQISLIAPRLPATLDAFFEKAFARGPDDRFQSAPEMATAFLTMSDLAAATDAPSGDVRQAAAPAPRPAQPSSPSHAGLPTPPSASGQVALPGGPAALAGPLVTPVSTRLAPREATPVSTTVGGTQLPSRFPDVRRKLAGQPLGLVVLAAGSIIVLVSLAVLLLASGSGPAPAPSAVASPVGSTATTPGDDDDAEDLAHGSDTVVADVEAPEGADAGSRAGGATPNPPVHRPRNTTPRGAGSGRKKRGGGKPDWGL